MKKIVASVGLVALGATSVQAESPSPFDTSSAKFWSVSARLRGFYDDNFNGAPDHTPDRQDAWGYEVSPSVNLNFGLEQTTIKASYQYTFKYYDHLPSGNTDKNDQSHIFNLEVDHSFNERYQLSVRDSFVIGQEPDLLRAGDSFSTFQRIPGDNIRNSGSINLDGQITRQLGFEVGYANSFYDYADDSVAVNRTPFSSVVGPVVITSVTPSRSGVLDNMNHLFHLDGHWQIQPRTIGVIGYQFSETAYTADQLVGGVTTNFVNQGVTTGQLYRSDVRNNRSHYGYLGVDQTFRADLSASIRAGGRYNEYYNDPYSQNEPSPYVNASLKYTYMAGSYAEFGGSYDRTVTDLFSATPGEGLTTDAQTATIWLNIHQRILPRLTGTLTTQVQHSDYNGGAFNNETDLFYLLGLNLTYQFNPHFSAEVGYDYDILDSDVNGRGFDRNRVYIGVTASY